MRRTTSSSRCSPLLWSEHCGYKHSAPLLRSAAVGRAARAAGPGRERRRDRPGRRHRGRLQGRVAQPPLRRRAVPGRCDRGRRDPARHHRHGSAPDRAARRAAVRLARLALPPRRRRHRPLRELRRRPKRRRRVRVRRRLRCESARERDVRRPAADRARPAGAGARRRERDRPLRRVHRPRRHRWRVRARLAGSGRLRRQAADRSDRRPVSRQGTDRGVARAGRIGARHRRCRTAARPAWPRHSPRWRATAWESTCTSTACRSASRTSSLGDHDLGVAGADDRGRRAGARRARFAPCASAGSCRAP